MFAKVYQYKFGTVSEAKVAASFCSDNLGKKISKYKFQSLNVMIGKDGDLSIFIKFDTIDRLKKYEIESDAFIKELKETFVFKENQYAGVFVYNYEAEATSSEIKISNSCSLIYTISYFVKLNMPLLQLHVDFFYNF
jgi:hypothetical protein